MEEDDAFIPKLQTTEAAPGYGQSNGSTKHQSDSRSEFQIKEPKWNLWSCLWPIKWVEIQPIKLQYCSIKAQFWRGSFRMLPTSHLSRPAARCLHSQGKFQYSLLAEKDYLQKIYIKMTFFIYLFIFFIRF